MFADPTAILIKECSFFNRSVPFIFKFYMIISDRILSIWSFDRIQLKRNSNDYYILPLPETDFDKILTTEYWQNLY